LISLGWFRVAWAASGDVIRKLRYVWSAGGSPADVSGRAARTPAYRVQCRFLRRFWALIGEINKRHALAKTRRKKATKFDQNMGIKKDRLKKCRSYYSKIKRTRKNKKYLIFFLFNSSLAVARI
jgi:hypothetical protein